MAGDLANNEIGDHGCNFLMKGQWNKLTQLNLSKGWNYFKVKIESVELDLGILQGEHFMFWKTIKSDIFLDFWIYSIIHILFIITKSPWRLHTLRPWSIRWGNHRRLSWSERPGLKFLKKILFENCIWQDTERSFSHSRGIYRRGTGPLRNKPPNLCRTKEHYRHQPKPSLASCWKKSRNFVLKGQE